MISLRLLRNAAGMNQTLAPAGCVMVPTHITGQDCAQRHLFTIVPAQQAATLSTPKRLKLSPELQGVPLPTKPKKPITPWLAFLHERKDDVLARNGPMTASQLAVVLAKDWQTTDKTRYQLEFGRKLEEYHRAKDDYENSLTDDQRAVIEHQKNLKKEAKDLRKLRSTKPPTRPRNPISLYSSERCKDADIKERMKHNKSTVVLNELKDEFKSLSDSAKDKYVEMHMKDRKRFEHEFNQWYQSVKSDSSLSKTVQNKADALQARFKALNYI